MPLDTKTIVRLPKELKREARIKALREDRNLSEVIRELLTQWLEEPAEEKTAKKKAKRKQTE